MLVMLQVTDPVERDHTMTKREGKGEVIKLKGLLDRDEDFVRSAVQALVQEALQAEMTEAIGAAKGERTEERLAYRSG
jgi:putative transposase